MNQNDDWIVEFFDDEYVTTYERSGYFDDTSDEVAAILEKFDLKPGSRILDVPCGWGRHAGLFHAAGMHVTGIDISEDQLRIANERNPGPDYVHADMRSISDGPFDGVVNLFSSIGYFEDAKHDLAALSAWHRSMRPDGWFVMETNHRDRVAHLYSDTASPSGVSTFDPLIDWQSGTIENVVARDDGTQRKSKIRIYSATEIVSLCEAAGFVDVHAFGGFRGELLSPKTRLVVYARA